MERAARIVIAVLILALPAVYLPRILASSTPERAAPRPAWAHLVVVTAERWPGAVAPPDSMALGALEADGVRIGPLFTPSLDPVAAAQGLWTGRWDGAGSPWSVAEAARRGGARTAVFANDPTPRGVAGFGRSEIRPGATADELVEAAEAFLAQSRGERLVLWVHLAEAGRGAGAFDATVGRLRRTLADLDLALDSVFVATTLRGSPSPALDAEALVPLWIALPTGLEAGKTSRCQLSLVDLAGGLVDLMRLPGPGPDEPALQSRSSSMMRAFSGGWPLEPVIVDLGPAGQLVRTGPGRYLAGAAGPPTVEALDPPYGTAPPRAPTAAEREAITRESEALLATRGH